MASRRIASDDFPFLPIRVTIRGWSTEAIALVDTGFSGDLVVPEGSIPSYIGPPNYPMTYRVADDRFTTTGLFYGELEIPGLSIIPRVSIGPLGSKYILGLGIIERYVVTFVRGQRIVVEE